MYRTILKDGSNHLLKGIRQGQCKLHSNSNMPKQAGFGKVLVLMTPIAVVGGVISYANYDKTFRKTIESNVPGSAVIFKFVIDDKPVQTVTKTFDSASEQIGSVTSSITKLFGTTETEKTPKPIPAPQKIEPKVQSKEIVSKPAAPVSPPPIIKPKPVETLPADVVGLEREIEVAASIAVQEYNKAIQVLNAFNEDVRKIVDKSVENIDPSSWTTLKNKTSARDISVEKAENSALEALKKLEKCEIALSKVATPSNHDRVMEVRQKIQTLKDHINGVKSELYKSKDSSTLSEKYWKKVEESRNYFVDQIENIFSGVNISEKQLNIPKEDLDLFILLAYSHVLAYQKELQRLQTDGELRLKRAIEAYRGDDQSAAIKTQLDYLIAKEKRRLEIEHQQKILQIRAESEQQLRKQLKQQAEAHVDHISDILALKEAELKRTFKRELDEKLGAEKAVYKLELAQMLGKLRGIDGALKARAMSERSAQQAQALWTACQSLWQTVRTGEPGVNWREKLRPLKSEIESVSKVAEGDELVSVVLQNLSETAKDRGVFPEDALRERFLNVENVARKLALVPEKGAGLPMYLLSYLQSLFILRPDEPISKNELDDKVVDFSKIDTYDILNRARYYVDRGDLKQALKYMNLLQGAPRKVASDWLKEVRLLLETQQAANTLMAHAAASGYIE